MMKPKKPTSKASLKATQAKFKVIDLSDIAPSNPWYATYLNLSQDLTPVTISELQTNFLLTPQESQFPNKTLTRLEFAEIAKRALEIRDCIAQRQDLGLPIEDTWPDQSIDPIKETQNKLDALPVNIKALKQVINDFTSELITSSTTVDPNNNTADVQTSSSQSVVKDSTNTQPSNLPSQNQQPTTNLDQTPDIETSTIQQESQTQIDITQELIDQQISEIENFLQELSVDPQNPQTQVDPVILPDDSVVIEDIACETCPCEYNINENEALKPQDQFFVILRNKQKTQILDQSNKVSPKQ